jgi:UDP:flavonoid glycosyltransferase YjiC (YdhE family)
MMRARIDLLSPPFAGHLHPIIGMARALHAHYEVRVVTTPSAAMRVRAAGIDSVSMLEGWEGRLAAIVDTPTAVGSNPLRLYGQLSKSFQVHEQVRMELERLYQFSRPDLVIADFTLVAAGAVTNAYGIPWWTSLPSPCVLEGGDGPPCYLGGLSPMTGVIGKSRDRLGWAAIRGFKRLVGTLLRDELRRVGVASVYRADQSEAAYSDQQIIALGWQDLEFRRNWPSPVCFIPPFLYSPPVPCEAPSFAPGRPHVLVTLGTHVRWIKDTAAAAVHEVAAQTPHIEYHFSDGDVGRTRTHHRQGNFQRLPYIDYDHVGQYDLVIHHGGAGIMAHCLAQGRPAIVYPIDYDQFDNSSRLEHAGLARRMRHLGGLQQAIVSALNDGALRERCERFARGHDASDAPALLRAKVDALLRANVPDPTLT